MSSAIKSRPDQAPPASGKLIRKKYKRTEYIPLKEEQKRRFWKLALGDSHTLLKKKSMITDRIEVGSFIRILCGKNRELIRRVIRVEIYDKLYTGEEEKQIKARMLGYEKNHRKDLKRQAESMRSSSSRLPVLQSTPLVVIEFDPEQEELDVPEASDLLGFNLSPPQQ